MEKGLIDIHIAYKDRPTELALLLQSLRTQTYKNFRIFISDDCSSTPINSYHFLICLINKLNQEGNYIVYHRNDFNLGVSKNRQKLIELSKLDNKAEYYLRLDDDIILEQDYIEKLLQVINKGHDLATGITPFIGNPMFKRQTKFIKPIANKIILDSEGNYIYNGDDFGLDYFEEEIIPIHHFRSCALFKKEIFDKVSYDNNLTKHGFREEQILCLKIMSEGFTMAVHTGARAGHLLTPSGGERFADSNELIKLNEEIMREFTKKLIKEKGNIVEKYNEKLGIKLNFPTKEECMNQCNLIRI